MGGKGEFGKGNHIKKAPKAIPLSENWPLGSFLSPGAGRGTRDWGTGEGIGGRGEGAGAENGGGTVDGGWSEDLPAKICRRGIYVEGILAGEVERSW